jgi:uncharacterized membrane protein
MPNSFPLRLAAICSHFVLIGSLLSVVLLVAPSAAHAQEPEALTHVDADGKVVSFQRDIAPLFVSRCLECHQGDKAKGGFTIDQRAAVLEYLVPEAPLDSTLYTDYLISTDPDMVMPPPAHKGPLNAAELALVRLWIEEGANWPDDATVAAPGESATAKPATTQPAATEMSLLQRLWAFQGYFHPATVHFPIALLTIGGLFVVIGVVWPKVGTQIPLACLIIGSLSAVVASMMGWSFANEQGFPSYTTGWGEEVNAHRWSGIIISIAGVIFSLIAIQGVRKNSRSLGLIWRLGLLALAALVGLVGHQGGELTYGPKLYERAFERLQGTDTQTPQP